MKERDPAFATSYHSHFGVMRASWVASSKGNKNVSQLYFARNKFIHYLIKQKKEGKIFGCLEYRRVRPKFNWKEIKDTRLGGSGIIQFLQFFLVYLLFYCCGLELIYR